MRTVRTAVFCTVFLALLSATKGQFFGPCGMGMLGCGYGYGYGGYGMFGGYGMYGGFGPGLGGLGMGLGCCGFGGFFG
ncbi:unnamed protein product [Gongylonema pulchrum]|uniref:Glycine rich protein n=1 Tax=Gongylonema pulchrum TaxID=637853 RepID=A0A183D372_9BILA|nr:unnamed protein product [Gongylonema pulchrum]